MAEPEKKQSWWQTLPGILTATAALITAVTGLAAVLLPNGMVGRHRPTVDPDTAAHGGTGLEEPGDGGPRGGAQRPDSSAAAGTRSWSETEARIRDRDGAVTALGAATLSACISVSHELTLVAGQSVPFERMRWFRVVRADPTGAPNARARVEIGLLAGDTLRGQVAADCDLFGYNDTGRFTVTLQRLDRVDFHR